MSHESMPLQKKSQVHASFILNLIAPDLSEDKSHNEGPQLLIYWREPKSLIL